MPLTRLAGVVYRLKGTVRPGESMGFGGRTFYNGEWGIELPAAARLTAAGTPFMASVCNISDHAGDEGIAPTVRFVSLRCASSRQRRFIPHYSQN